MKPRRLYLRSLGHLAGHFARTREIEPALRHIAKRSQKEVRAVDICIHRGELVVERVTHETLCGKMIAFIRLNLAHNLIQAGVTLERTGVQSNLIANSG